MTVPSNRTLFVLLLACTPSCALLAGIEDFTYVGRDASITEDAGGDGIDAEPLADGDVADTSSDVSSRDGTADGACPCQLANQTCVQNECFPQVFASGLQDPQTIVTAGNFVVWAENGSAVGAGRVRACPAAGCAATGPVAVSSNLVTPSLRRAGPDGVPVMFESGRGGGGTPVKRVQDNLSLDTIAPALVPNLVGATATATSIVFGTATTIYSCATSSCSPSGFAQPAGTSRAMMIVDNMVYVSPQSAGLVACDLPDCPAPATFLPGENVRDVQGDTNAVYAVAGNMAVWVIKSSVAKPESVAVPGQPRSLAVANDFVYVVVPTTGIYALDRATKTLAPKYLGGSPLEITVAGAFLYWTDKNGTVLRAPR